MATEGSARVLGMGDFIGKIAKGYKADLVLLDLDHVNFVPLNNATNQIVFTESGGGAAVERLAALNADARRQQRSLRTNRAVGWT
jgi:cytosine/adenosine deaminase-related metal-dependent hydrolase